MQTRKRVRLPHWDIKDGSYFVTFNLNDAFPVEYKQRLERERHVRMSELERMKEKATPAEIHEIERVLRERAEEMLDEGAGESYMRDPRIAQLVADAITHFDEERYLLFAWVVMPNHVHVVFRADDALDKILQSWKSFTAKEANKLLKRSGTFWQEDYWDHSVRDRADFDRLVKYVLENPIKAGFSNWPFVRSYPSRF